MIWRRIVYVPFGGLSDTQQHSLKHASQEPHVLDGSVLVALPYRHTVGCLVSTAPCGIFLSAKFKPKRTKYAFQQRALVHSIQGLQLPGQRALIFIGGVSLGDDRFQFGAE